LGQLYIVYRRTRGGIQEESPSQQTNDNFTVLKLLTNNPAKIVIMNEQAEVGMIDSDRARRGYLL